VPAKVRVYPEHLAKRTPPTLHRDLYQRARNHFQATGVAAADLLPTLADGKRGEPTYLRTDTHWTPYGAALAAAAIVEPVRKLQAAPPAAIAFETKTSGSQEHRGDLFNFLPLDPYFGFLLPPPDALDVVRTERGGGADADLLGDAVTPQIALVGTSYSAEPKWNFHGALQKALGQDVGNYARQGLGPFAPMFEYLRSRDFKDAPPRLVVWEIPERYLVARQALDEYQLPPEAFEGASKP
jgi:alginate O-acetyltransferase complex protein AlgJ